MKSLFGTDGVRGIAGKPPLTRPEVRRLGAAAVSVYREEIKHRRPFFLLGRDTRSSGRWIAEAFAQGAASQGVVLRDVGITSTPSIAYLVPAHKALGGVMISASHNPAEFNGIKLFNADGRKCPDAWEHRIEQRLGELPDFESRRVRMMQDAAAVRDYLRFLKSSLSPNTRFQGLTLVVDCSNGSLSKIAPAFLRSLGARVIPLGTAPNGRNINAGCGSQETGRLQRAVRAHRAHGGMAFDGDADRIILCDETGKILDGDFVLACVAHCLKREKRLTGNTVVVTVMANLGLIKALKASGIRALVTPVGDRYVAEKLDAEGLAVGGEQSGHIIFHNLLPTGDGLLTGLQVLSMLRRIKKPLSWISTLMVKYPQVLHNVHVSHKKPIESCPGVAAAIRQAEDALGSDGRVLVRYSGTEPLLRIMMEGPSEARLKELAGRIAEEAHRSLGNGHA